MSASVNKVILLGNLGGDPELRSTGTGKSVCNFTLATNEGSGDNRRTEWHRIVVWDKLAESCGQYLRKGRQVYIEGRLTSREWEGQDGGKRQTIEIVAHTVQFLGERSGEAGDQPAPPRGQGGGWGHGDHDAGGQGGGWGKR